MEANNLMKQLITDFPSQLKEALEIAKSSTFHKSPKEIRNVIICGMGGSGIGGLIVSQWLFDDLKVPVGFCQDYDLPNYVDEHTLVIASSYSGNTEETLMSLEGAIAKGSKIVGITSGGKLAELCKKNGYDFVLVPGGNPPRASMGYSIVQLVNIFVQLNMCPAERLLEIQKGIDLIVANQTEIQKEAREIAKALEDKIPVFYASAAYAGLTVRARQQFNENSKKLALAHNLPEMNHNELLGWTGGDSRFGVLFLETNDLNIRNKKRVEITLSKIREKTETVIIAVAKGNSRIDKTIYLNNLIDWASYYIAEIKGIDSVEIDVIDFLKESLAKV
jgi:glucose/mannose-6-phosphate isomerase